MTPLSAMPTLSILLLAAVLFGWAAVTDLQRYVIPHSSIVGLIILYPLLLLTMPSAIALAPNGLVHPSLPWLDNILLALLLFALGVALFKFGLFGGGDIKLLAVVGLWAGPGLIWRVFWVIGIVGGALALLVLAARLYQRHRLAAAGTPPASLPRIRGTPVPYGVAISAGGLDLLISIANFFIGRLNGFI